jgi:hypothetical protein
VDAVVLAGGYATRLWPITRNRAKPLLPVADGRLVDHVLEPLEDEDRVDDVYLSTNERFADDFRRYIDERGSSAEVVVEPTTSEDEKLGTIGALAELVDRRGIDDETLVFSQHLACPNGHGSFDELAPRNFSFNSPYGACDTCDGLGTRYEVDPELVVPDPGLSLEDEEDETAVLDGGAHSVEDLCTTEFHVHVPDVATGQALRPEDRTTVWTPEAPHLPLWRVVTVRDATGPRTWRIRFLRPAILLPDGPAGGR